MKASHSKIHSFVKADHGIIQFCFRLLDQQNFLVVRFF